MVDVADITLTFRCDHGDDVAIPPLRLPESVIVTGLQASLDHRIVTHLPDEPPRPCVGHGREFRDALEPLGGALACL